MKRLQKEGVVCIDVGTKYETSKLAIELAENNDGIYAAIGMHPIHIKTDLMKLKIDADEGTFEPLGEEYDKARYRELAKLSKKIVAIGEIGLDYYYRPKGTGKTEKFKQKQKEIFIQQLVLAEELNLPVIIHCRSAFDDLYEILSYSLQTTHYKLRGVIHCFSGTWEEAKKYLDLGFYLGINGIIYKLDLKEVIEKTPLEKILLETDCPYLTPPLARRSQEGEGGRNEPIFVKYIAEEVAKIKKISLEQVAEVTTNNVKELFRI